MPRMTIPEIIEELENELSFVEKWLLKPQGMLGYLLGKRNILLDAIKKLKDYEG